MKNRSLINSFRIEIVLYSMLSLLYTIITEVIVYFIFIYSMQLISDLIGEDNLGTGFFSNINIKIPVKEATDYFDGSSITGITYPMKEFLAANKEYLTITIITALVLGVILFILYFLLLTKRFSNYLYEISEGITDISNGNFDIRIPVKSEDEFAVIASRINDMAADISIMMENERKREDMKHDLITSVAHDLRTPLTSILGYLDLASKEEYTAQREKYVTIAYEKSKRLERLIEDLFSYTKFSSDDVKIEKQKLDVVFFMQQMVDEFYPSFRDANLTCTFSCYEKELSCSIDGNLMARAIGNLLSNAVKYGKDGKQIKIDVEKRNEQAIIRILNYGKIIPKEDLDNIFDRFYRVESSRSLDTGGTGLGLAIAKKIILLNGGTIHVTSGVAGTCFEVRIPLEMEEGKI